MKHKSALITFPVNGLHRPVLIITLTCCLTTFAGCASSRKSIKSIWPAKAAEIGQDGETAKTPDEPQVAANIALGNDLPEKKPSPLRRGSRSDSAVVVERKSSTTRSNGDESKVVERQPETVDPAMADKSKTPDSSIDRLNAALRDESPSDSLPQRSLTALEDRMKVNALVSQAQRLLDVGQIEQARQIASAAMELGETSQVDYAPDEDRPIDLIRRIDGQLEAVRLKNEARSVNTASNSTATPVAHQVEENTETADASSSKSKEQSNFSRLRRDLSTLFHRDKKGATQETIPTLSDPKPISSITPVSKPVEPSPNDRTLRTPSKTESREAVVVANRSVSLGHSDEESAQNESFVQVNDQLEWIDDDTPNLSSSSDGQRSKAGELPGLLEIPIDEQSSAASSNSDRDDIPQVMTDFDLAKSASGAKASNEAQSGNAQTSSEILQNNDEPPRSDSSGLFIAFGICAILAIGYYRRGAT